MWFYGSHPPKVLRWTALAWFFAEKTMPYEPDDLTDLEICEDCGTVYDRYTTDECPNCEEPSQTCNDCGEEIVLEVIWGEFYIEEIRYECQQCGRAGTAEVSPKP